MIVKGDKDYSELFQAAETQLGLSEGTINNLHEYFNIVLKDNRDNIRQQDSLTNLLHLPLPEDEPLFVINANTREIEIPPVFKQNGLTVKGDKLAEIIYFKIDRFFDLQDFNRFTNKGLGTTNNHTGDHCYIEWYNPSAKTPEYQKGVDLAFAMTADEDFVYFGWPIADKVAGDSGTIQFSVRFLSIEDGIVKYNFATKIATCEIKNTLNFALDDTSITAMSYEDLIYTRPMYSGIVNSTQSPAPALLLGIISHVADMTYGKIGVETIPGVHHEASGDENDGHNGEAWDEEPTTRDIMGYYLDIPVVANISAAVQQQQTLEFKWYKDSGFIGATEESNYVTNEPAGGEYPETAVKSTYRAHATGDYTVYIGNKIEGQNSTRYVYTGTVSIPGPEEVVIDNSGIVAQGFVGEIHSEGLPSGWLTAGISNTVDHADLKYTWFVGDGEIVREADSDPRFYPTDEGLYYCGVTNSRNGDTTDFTNASFSNVADVRMQPQKLTDLIFNFDDNAKVLTATAVHTYTNHKIEYQWYYTPVVDINAGETDQQKLLKTFTTGAYDELVPEDPGIYQVVATEVVFDENTALRRKSFFADITRSKYIYLTKQDGQLVYTPMPGSQEAEGTTGTTGEITGTTGEEPEQNNG